MNLVASANLNATLALYNLAITIPTTEYEPEQFPGAILKLKEPKVSMLLFKNGKVICSGASSEREISLSIRKASKLIVSELDDAQPGSVVLPGLIQERSELVRRIFNHFSELGRIKQIDALTQGSVKGSA